MKGIVIDLVLWLLASPILFLCWLVRVVRHFLFLRLAYRCQLVCQNCRATVSLVGLWRCGCGFTYRGHVLRVCPACGSLPRMVRCYSCGVTRRLPEP